MRPLSCTGSAAGQKAGATCAPGVAHHAAYDPGEVHHAACALGLAQALQLGRRLGREDKV
eukprot:1147655-Pelagomonas_calceolata.AAC.2